MNLPWCAGIVAIALFSTLHAPLFSVLGAFGLLLPSLAFCVLDAIVPAEASRKAFLMLMDLLQLRHLHAFVSDDPNITTLHTLQLIFGTLLQVSVHTYGLFVRWQVASVIPILSSCVVVAALYCSGVVTMLLRREKQEWVMESPVTRFIIMLHVATDVLLHVGCFSSAYFCLLILINL